MPTIAEVTWAPEPGPLALRPRDRLTGARKALLSFAVAVFFAACGGPTEPPEPFPGLQEVAWNGLAFSATSHVTEDTLIVVVTASNPGPGQAEALLPGYECLGYVRVYRDGDWEWPVLDMMTPFGGWCHLSEGDSVRVRLDPGESYSHPNWTHRMNSLSQLPGGRYVPAIRIPRSYLGAGLGPPYLLEAGEPFDRP